MNPKSLSHTKMPLRDPQTQLYEDMVWRLKWKKMSPNFGTNWNWRLLDIPTSAPELTKAPVTKWRDIHTQIRSSEKHKVTLIDKFNPELGFVYSIQ